VNYTTLVEVDLKSLEKMKELYGELYFPTTEIIFPDFQNSEICSGVKRQTFADDIHIYNYFHP
jgi:hypothetical protein